MTTRFRVPKAFNISSLQRCQYRDMPVLASSLCLVLCTTEKKRFLAAILL